MTDRSTASHPRNRLPALDGVRGLAILLVMVNHTFPRQTALPMLEWGWTGVDLFFVLSGFLITGVLLDHPGAWRTFYARRVLRIFPLYYAFLVIFFLASYWVPTQPLLAALRAHQIWLWAYAANIWIAVHGGFLPYVNQFWTLAVEEHFYLLWPLIVYRSNKLWAWVIGLCVVALVSRCVWVWWHGPSPAVYVLTPWRMDAILLGAGLQLWYRKGDDSLARWSRWVTWAGVLTVGGLALAGYSIHFLQAPVQSFGFTLIDVFYAAVVGLSLTHAATARLFQGKLLRFFGVHAYGLYIVHETVFEVVRAYVESPWAAFAATWMAAMLIAWASFRWFETPLLRLKPRY